MKYYLDVETNVVYAYNENQIPSRENLKQIPEKEALEIAALKTPTSDVNYLDDRAAMYPSIADQLDMQYHDLINNTTTWLDTIKNIKDSIPKVVGVTKEKTISFATT